MKILALGIGNILFNDEGIGVYVCNFLNERYAFSHPEHEVDFVDGGTLAMALIPIISQYDELVVFDCINADDDIGSVYFFDFENVPEGVNWQGTAHEVEMLQTLSMMDLAGDRPPTKIIGIIPKIISSTSREISNEVRNGAKTMQKSFLSYIKEKGFTVSEKSDINLDDAIKQTHGL